MQRRTLLRLGLGATVTLALAGGGAAWLRPGWADGRLSASGRAVMHAVARAVLDGSLPADAAARDAALTAHLGHLDTAVAAFPDATRSELSQLLALLAAPPGRLGLAGLGTPWPSATVADIQAAMQDMRGSRLALRQQAYHALRDLTNAAFYANDAAWPAMGYPGPRLLNAPA